VLIRQARSGSTEALGELLEQCRRYLLLVANSSLDSDLRSKRGASDLVQDTFIVAHQGFLRFEGTTEQELLAWLTKILSRRLSKNVRQFRHTHKNNVEREVSISAGYVFGGLAHDATGPIESIIARDEAECLQAAINRLPVTMREVLTLRTWERMSFVEIAARLKATPDSVRKVWGRALKRLQDELQQSL
jgi:RNA polymerase sigma-70 factor (ECF subfamily)